MKRTTKIKAFKILAIFKREHRLRFYKSILFSFLHHLSIFSNFQFFAQFFNFVQFFVQFLNFVQFSILSNSQFLSNFQFLIFSNFDNIVSRVRLKCSILWWVYVYFTSFRVFWSSYKSYIIRLIFVWSSSSLQCSVGLKFPLYLCHQA